MSEYETVLVGWRKIGGHIGVSRRTARRLHDRWPMPVYQAGRATCCKRGELDEWLAERKEEYEG